MTGSPFGTFPKSGPKREKLDVRRTGEVGNAPTEVVPQPQNIPILWLGLENSAGMRKATQQKEENSGSQVRTDLCDATPGHEVQKGRLPHPGLVEDLPQVPHAMERAEDPTDQGISPSEPASFLRIQKWFPWSPTFWVNGIT